jgi:hypothetical protein
MRCPYCGGINADQAAFCVHCGRDLKPRPNQQPPRQPSSHAPNQPLRGPAYPPPAKPAQQPYNAPGRGPAAPVQAPSNSAQQTGRGATITPSAPPAPEPPAPFPPQSMEQLRALEPGALAYTVTDTALVANRKKVIAILYPRCTAWQQVATLLKAYKEQQEDKLGTIIIQGYWHQQSDIYAFTNGQLIVDRGVLLGSQKINRYQIETDNGFEITAVRIVLSEPVTQA